MREEKKKPLPERKTFYPCSFPALCCPMTLWQRLHESFYRIKCFLHWVLYFSCSLRSVSAPPPPQQISSCSSSPGFVSIWGPPLRMERHCQFLQLPLWLMALRALGWHAGYLCLLALLMKSMLFMLCKQKWEWGGGSRKQFSLSTNFSQGNHCFCCIAQEHIVF